MANEPDRVIRGGGWYDVAAFARVAYRFGLDPGDRRGFLGIRLVRVVNSLQQLAEVNNDGQPYVRRPWSEQWKMK